MHPFTQQLTALRLDLVVALRQDDTNRVITDVNELLTLINSIHTGDLKLSLIDKVIFIFLKRRLMQILKRTIVNVKEKLVKELELCNLKVQLLEEKKEGVK